MENKIEIYTDGSCIGNPGPGGWAAIILFDKKEIEIKGRDKGTTNNRMEMTAVINAFKWLREKSKIKEDDLYKSKIHLYSDSNLIIQTMLQGWKKKANTDLWAKIDKETAWLPITWVWVKAHAENNFNNRVDELAFGEANKA